MSTPDYVDYAEERDEPSREEQEGDAWEHWHQRSIKFEAALHRLQTQYAEEIADLEAMKARGDLTKDYGEQSLYHARRGLERVRAALTSTE